MPVPDDNDGIVRGGLPYWDQRDWQNAWDSLNLGGEDWPGVCEISGAGVSRKIDIKKQAGTDGSTMTDEGYQPARLTISITIHNWDQWDRMQELMPTVHPRKKGGTRTPLSIAHPQANFLGITQIYIDKIGIPKKPSAGDGLLTLSMSAVEWVPSPKPVKTGAGTSTGSGKTSAGTVDDHAATMDDLSNALGVALVTGNAEEVERLGNLINNMSYDDPPAG